MKVKVIRILDDYVLNVRDTDELLDDGTLANEEECAHAENCLRKVGTFYVNHEIMLKPVSATRS